MPPLPNPMPILLGASFLVLSTMAGALAPIFLSKKLHLSINHHDFACFSAGIITYSIFETISHSVLSFGILKTSLGFLSGFLAFLALEFLLQKTRLLEKMSFHIRSILVALTIAVHNIAEGLAVGSAFLLSDKAGLEIAIPISLQDVPEGFLVSSPLIAKGMNPFLAAGIGTLSGVFEAGVAFVSWETLSALLPYALGASAGGMAFIALFDLLPEIEEYSGAPSRKKIALALLGFSLGGLSLFALAL